MAEVFTGEHTFERYFITYLCVFVPNGMSGESLILFVSYGFNSKYTAVTNLINICLFRKPFAVSFISQKVFALCQEDDGECDRALSTETGSRFCVLCIFSFSPSQ